MSQESLVLLQQHTAWQHPSVGTGACCLAVLRVCVCGLPGNAGTALGTSTAMHLAGICVCTDTGASGAAAGRVKGRAAPPELAGAGCGACGGCGCSMQLF